MHLDIYLRILVAGIIPSSKGSEDLKQIQAQNRWKFGLYSAGLCLLLLGMYVVAKVSLANRYIQGIPLDMTAFLLAGLFVGGFGMEFIISKLTIPLGAASKLNPALAHKCWEARNHDYIPASKTFTKAFWKLASSSSQKTSTLMSNQQNQQAKMKPTETIQYAATASMPVAQPQKMQGSLIYMLVLATIVAVIAVLNFFGVKFSFIGSAPIVTVPLIVMGILMLALIGALIKVSLIKEKSLLKAGATFLCVFMLVTLGAGMVAWGTASVRNDLMAMFNGIDYGAASRAAFSAKLAETNQTETPTATASNTPTSTSTEIPSPTPRVITKSSGVYSVKSQEIAGDDMAANLGQIALNANLGIEAYTKMLAKMYEENADSATWKEFYWAEEGIAAASIKNRGYLNIGTTKDGRAVADFFSRVEQLKQDGALTSDTAYQLKAIATLLNEWWNRQDKLGLLLVKTQEILDTANGDSSKVDTSQLADVFGQAKNVVIELNDLTDAYNTGRLPDMPEILKISVPEGKEFIEFLETSYAADSEDVYYTATPGPKPENIANTLIPPTDTPEPTATFVPTETQDACHAGISTDEQASSYQGDYSRLESLSVELQLNKALRVERWSDECGGWVFSIVNYNDEIYYWGVVKDISTTTGYGQYGSLSHDRSNFRIVSLDDPTGNRMPMIVIEETGEYLIRNWPAPVLPSSTPVPGGGQPVRTCQKAPPGYFDSQRLNIRWDELNGMFPGMQGTFESEVNGEKLVRPKASVWFYACPNSDEYFFILFVKDRGSFWLVGSNTPPGMRAQQAFWFKEDGTPYELTSN